VIALQDFVQVVSALRSLSGWTKLGKRTKCGSKIHQGLVLRKKIRSELYYTFSLSLAYKEVTLIMFQIFIYCQLFRNQNAWNPSYQQRSVFPLHWDIHRYIIWPHIYNEVLYTFAIKSYSVSIGNSAKQYNEYHIVVIYFGSFRG
jgi:hypothetical protein